MTSQATPAAADHSSRARVGVGTVALNIGVFLAAFALVCALIQFPTPLDDVPGVGPKYTYFAQHKDEYNLLFLGSSRVFHHFLPKQFDQQIRERTGIRVKSFNFGYDGMWPPESFYTLRKVLALRPRELKWVLIDMIQINPRLDPENMGTLRTQYWHDWHHTKMAWAALSGERASIWHKCEIALVHAEYLAKRWTNAGRSAEWLSEVLRVPNKKRPKPSKWEPTNGYEAGLNRVMAGKELKSFEKQVEMFRPIQTPAKLRPEMKKAVAEIAAEVRAAGAEPIFVLAPTVDRREKIFELPGAELFSFADADKYPALYDAANHYDAWHLNETGAHLFTGHLADRFGAWLRQRAVAEKPAGVSK